VKPVSFTKFRGFRRVGWWHAGVHGLEFTIDAPVRNKKRSLYGFVDGSRVKWTPSARQRIEGNKL